ncbi:MAG: SgcJ/EcaC family oxidoreductase [Bacteroidota bacterium]
MPSLETPEQIVSTFVEAWNERDARKLASVFVDKAEFVNVTGLWWHNRERIFQAHDYGLRVIFNHSTLEVVRTKTRMLSEEIATIHAKLRLTNQTPQQSDQQAAVRTTIFLFVVQQSPEGWKCEVAQNTEVFSGKETFVVDEEGNRSAVSYGKFGE